MSDGSDKIGIPILLMHLVVDESATSYQSLDGIIYLVEATSCASIEHGNTLDK